MAADGSVVLDVDLNVSDAEKELARLKSRVLKLEDEINEKAFKRSAISSQLVKARKELEKLQSDVPSALSDDGQWADNTEYYELLKKARDKVSELEKAHKKINEEIEASDLALEYTKMRYGEVLPLAQELRKEENARAEAEKQAKEEAKAAAQQAKEEERLAREQAKRADEIAKEVSAAVEARIAQQRLLDIKERSVVVDQNLVNMQEELAQLMKRRKELESAGVGLGYQEYDQILVRTKKINQEIRNYQDGLLNATEKTKHMGNAMGQAEKKTSSFTRRLKGILTSAFIFNILSAGLRQFTAWLGNAVKSNDKAAAAIARLKGALLTLVQPILSVVIPVFITLVNLLTKVASAIASVVSAVFGTTAEESAAAAESLYNQQKGLNGVGAAAKKAGKQLAAFDEINKLSAEESGSGAGGGAGGDIKPEFDPSFIGDGINSVLELLVGSALLAVGAILTFSGAHPLLGIALMVAGAVTMWSAVKNNPELVAKMAESGLALVFQIIGPMIAIIGIVLLVTGHILLGISLIIAGIFLFAVGSAAGEDGDFVENVKDKLLEAARILGPLLAVIGLLLICTGRLLLGLGLFIAGIALFSIAEEAGDDGKTLQEKIISVLKNTAKIVGPVMAVIGIFLIIAGRLLIGLGMLIFGIAIWGISEEAGDDGKSLQDKIVSVIEGVAKVISTVLSVIGIFFLVTGNLLLGLGFLLAGIALFHIGEQAGDDGKSLEGKIMGVINGIAQTLQVLGPALVVIGIILLFTGIAAPLGLGMIVAGAGMFVIGTIAPNWNFIQEKLQDAWESVKEWWNTHVAKFFTWDYWRDLGKSCIDGLFGGFELGSKVKNWGKSMLGEVEDTFGINSPSTEFRELGEYMMAGLLGGINNQSAAVETAFSALFAAALALCTQNTGLMQAALVAFLLYLTAEFGPDWKKSWETCYQNTHSQILLVLRDIDALNARLAAIERSITITITTIRREVNEVSAPGSASSAASKMAKMPAIRQSSVPALAKGAVIPPNRAFLAVLGDQKSGTNVEAPAGLIRQMVAEGIRAAGSAGGARDIHITLELDRQVFARAVYKANNDETQRVGVRFAGVRA